MTQTAQATDWGLWHRLEPALQLSPQVLREILDGGQSFRWNALGDGVWEGQWARHIAQLRLDTQQNLEWSAPLDLESAVATALPRYFGLHRDYAEIINTLPWRCDDHLRSAIDAWPGLRTLNQPLGETVLTFLCSSNKQIVQIKQISHDLARNLGSEVCPGFYALPTWEELRGVSEIRLRRCRLGYRARYIRATARFLADHPGYLEEVAALPYPDAQDQLTRLSGVGNKVADCILLFGAGRLEVFPVDVWIRKTMKKHYGLEFATPDMVAQFGRQHFGRAAGLAQQFLFAAERRMIRA